jgi:hypothetical protein
MERPRNTAGSGIKSCRNIIFKEVSKTFFWKTSGIKQLGTSNFGQSLVTESANTFRPNLILSQAWVAPLNPPAPAAVLHSFASLKFIFVALKCRLISYPMQNCSAGNTKQP